MTSKYLWILFVAVATTFTAFGQVTEFPIFTHQFQKKSLSSSARTTQIVLQLPFWEDFSQYEPGSTTDSLWMNSEDVFINDHYAHLPPSRGVATFDGLRGDGLPYSNDPESSERNDRLTSNFIDLSNYSPSDNIYMSFFYQLGGYGEAPDPQDGDILIVEFKDADSVWSQAMAINPEGELNPEGFYQVLIPINNADFFHDKFQFAITNFGNQSGPFDVWNVDYIYINTGRSSNDEYYPDRTIVHGLSNIFNDYAAIPRAHLDFEEDFSVPYYGVKTLYNTFQTYRQQVTITVFTDEDTIRTEYGQTTQGTGTPIFQDEIDTVSVPFPLTADGFPEVDSSVYRLDYKIAVNTFDNRIDSGNYDIKYEPIDFRINDTIRQSFFFEDYYAYDDGSAESSAGLEVEGNTLAYMFTLREVDSAYIHSIDINTVYSGSTGIGKKVQLHVWNTRNGQPRSELIKENFVISGENSPTGFYRYNFTKPAVVKDTFFIGLTLNSSGRLPIGLDKSADNAEKILENINGEWLPIGERIRGSLMMRPVFGPEPKGPVTGIEGDITIAPLTIYPNPSLDGTFFIKGKVVEIQAHSISGQTIEVDLQTTGNNESRLFISRKGIFILKVVIDNNVYYRKVFIK